MERDMKQLFGRHLRKLREARGLTQSQLAELVDLSPVTLSDIESGRIEPRFTMLMKLPEILGVESKDLFTF